MGPVSTVRHVSTQPPSAPEDPAAPHTSPEPRAKAETLMMPVHTQGRAVVSTGAREQMEADTEAMHGYGLWATFQKDD